MGEFKGNRWYKCDFHLHTPASECFMNKDVTPEQFIEKVKEEGLECIAVTDHNAISWIDKIRDCGRKEGVVVFPGVEITCSDSKVHLLILFDINTKVSDIEFFLRQSGIEPSEFGKNSAHSNESIIKIVELASKSGAIVIPAHVDCYSGLSEVSHQTKIDFLELPSINVVQMVKKKLIQNNIETIDGDDFFDSLSKEYKSVTEENLKKYIECTKLIKNYNKGILTFSDNPESEGSSKHGLWGIGKQYSLIKMGDNPTLESLRQAFLFSDVRIKNCFDENSSKELLPEMWIRKISIKDIELLDDSVLEVDFNPYLTTIIGGRGSGKSTIIRFLTGVFSDNKIKVFKEIYDDFKRFYSISNKGEGVLTNKTEILVELVKNNIDYRIIATDFKTNGECKKKIEKYNNDSDEYEELEDISVEDLFLLDIYNQKQIYNLSKKPSVLREKIDTLITSMSDKKDKLQQYSSDYKKQYAKIKEINSKINTKKKKEMELKDIKEKIDLYKSTGINELLVQYERFNKQNSIIQKYLDNIEENISNLKEVYQKISINDYDLDVFDEKYKDDIQRMFTQYDEKFNERKEFINKIITELEEIKRDYVQSIKESEWYIEHGKIIKEYNEGLQILQDKWIDTKTINELFSKQENKQKELDEVNKLEKIISEENTKLKSIKKDYMDLRNTIFELRKEKINELLLDTNIHITLKKYRDSNNFISNFRAIVQKPEKYDEDIESIKNYCFKGNSEKQIALLVDEIMKIKYENKSDSTLFGKRFITVLKGLNDEQIAMLNLLVPEDDIEVSYKPNGASSFKKLINASAGQKTSTMLAFILSDGTIPLILDQPEDDLDNHLISELVVERLKKCKEHRQIIVVTHNANIPVNGDAELVVSMNSESKGIEIYNEGTLEESVVKKEICDVMEGGEKAFKMRANRYSLI